MTLFTLTGNFWLSIRSYCNISTGRLQFSLNDKSVAQLLAKTILRERSLEKWIWYLESTTTLDISLLKLNAKSNSRCILYTSIYSTSIFYSYLLILGNHVLLRLNGSYILNLKNCELTDKRLKSKVKTLTIIAKRRKYNLSLPVINNINKTLNY